MDKLKILDDLMEVIARATADGVFDEMAGSFARPEVINEFCDAVLAMRAHEREKQQA